MNDCKPLPTGTVTTDTELDDKVGWCAPIKATLKAPGTKRLRLKYGKLVSHFGFKFNLRRYHKEKKDKTKVGQCRLTLSQPV